MLDFLPHGEWLGNSFQAWIFTGIGALVGYLLVTAIVAFVRSRLRKASERHPSSKTLFLSAMVVAATRNWIVLLLAIVIGLHALKFPPGTDRWLSWAVGALIGIQLAFWVSRLAVALLRGTTTADSQARGSRSVIFGLLTWAVELVIWVTLLLVLLANAGVNINAFVASLGIGGLAFAFAAQKVLADIFASIAIGLDKPFEPGDFITFGSELGTVKRVGIKTTRITALSGEELVVSNTWILDQVIHNLSRRDERRIVFGFSLSLDATSEQIEEVVQAVRGFIEDEDGTRLDRGHFLGIGDTGFRLEFVFYMLDPAYGVYCDAQQRINFRLMHKLEAMGLDFGVPIRTVQSRVGAGESTVGGID